METFSLLDDEKQATLRTDLTVPEMYKTRLLRLDLGLRSRADPIQDWFHQWLREWRYSRHLKRAQALAGGVRTGSMAIKPVAHNWSYQDSLRLSAFGGRFITMLVTGVFVVAPLVILSPKSSILQSTVIAVCIVIFSFLVATALTVFNFEMIAISAAYAAALSVVISSS